MNFQRLLRKQDLMRNAVTWLLALIPPQAMLTSPLWTLITAGSTKPLLRSVMAQKPTLDPQVTFHQRFINRFLCFYSSIHIWHWHRLL